MRIVPTNPSTSISSRGYVIKADQNKHCEFLYNKISEVLGPKGQTVVYTPTEVKFDKLTKYMKEQFEKLKILVEETKK